jgi:hypothetical protein
MPIPESLQYTFRFLKWRKIPWVVEEPSVCGNWLCFMELACEVLDGRIDWPQHSFPDVSFMDISSASWKWNGQYGHKFLKRECSYFIPYKTCKWYPGTLTEQCSYLPRLAQYHCIFLDSISDVLLNKSCTSWNANHLENVGTIPSLKKSDFFFYLKNKIYVLTYVRVQVSVALQIVAQNSDFAPTHTAKFS